MSKETIQRLLHPKPPWAVWAFIAGLHVANKMRVEAEGSIMNMLGAVLDESRSPGPSWSAA